MLHRTPDKPPLPPLPIPKFCLSIATPEFYTAMSQDPSCAETQVSKQLYSPFS